MTATIGTFCTGAGACARAAGIDALYALGDLAAHAARTFGSGAKHYTRIEDLLADLQGVPGPQTTMLVKGSRFMQMERVVKRFEQAGGA